jgi:Helicase conserved C-terminal domain
MAIDNFQELCFVQYLFTRIKDELTGRGVAEILGDGPRDRLHAGVLFPLEPDPFEISDDSSPLNSSLMDNGHTSGSRSRASSVKSDSAMSIDFQIRVPDGIERFALRITPHFSVYYAVFPTRVEVQTSQNQSVFEEELTEEAMSGDVDDVTDDLANQETEPDRELLKNGTDQSIPRQIAERVVQSVEQPGKKQDNSLVLPRKFRRRQVEMPPIEITLSLGNINPPLEIRDPFISFLADMRTAILEEDPAVWRHLGRPADGSRELRGDDLLINDEAFQKTLLKAVQGEIALPTWRAYLTISGEQSLLASSDGSGQVLRINVALVNATPSIPRVERARAQLEECALFDCGFSVEVDECELVPFEFQGTAKDYRYNRLFPAIGSNCIALAVEESGRQKLYTETVPLYKQLWYRTRNDFPVAFADLDDHSTSKPVEKLRELGDHMNTYLAEWDEYLLAQALTELDPEQRKACFEDRQNFAGEVARFKLGVEVLQKDTNLLRAFRLMNRVFRENGEQRTPPIASWRLFQLAFMVIQLPTLAAREYDLESGEEYAQTLKTALQQVDVLWFPTGGGKTEAYLGLITTALFYDRLRGKSRGVSAWMRFPLRMLSLQQLERLARVVARAEMIRASERDLRSLSGDPFAIGYYVGSSNTPNRIREADLPTGSASERNWERQQIIRYCPFCGGNIGMKFDRKQWRLIHFCHDPQCYSNTSAGLGELRGSLPIFVVDNEIYRYRPSILVGTVDKLAVLGFQKYFAHLTSAVDQRCPLHGYTSFGQCIEGGDGPCKLTTKALERLQPDKDPVPAFLIQDELHLLKEELGTFNAHYEGFLQYIASKQGQKPAKILAATATIEAYEEQIYHLYLKDAKRFPQPSWRAGESFYATSTPTIYRRFYSGVLTHQRSPENAALRALEIYHREIQRMRDFPDLALEELGFANINQDEFLDFLRLYDLSLTYVNRKATGGNIDYGLYQSISPRLHHPLTAEVLTGDNTMTEVGQVIERIEKERHEVAGQRLDALIATNLISHGVDLERINFLCMVGMPSKYAEYIQASSRAARNHVGLVIACFKKNDLRERSQYHYFLPNHQYLDRLVESVSINRFSSFAAQRTVPGLIVGMLLSHYSRILFNSKRITKPLDNMRQLHEMVKSGFISLERLREDLQNIIGTQDPKLSDLQRRYLIEGIAQALQTNWDQIQRSLDQHLRDAIHPMLSFRDIDETLDFVADGASGVFVERIRN